MNLHKINGIISNDSKINKNIVKHKHLSNSVIIEQSNYANQIIKDQVLDYEMKEGYLIDKEFFKFMESYLNLDNDEPYYDQLLKSSTNNIKNLYSKKIQGQLFIINNKQLIYPINFDVINKETFGKISKILNNKIPKDLYEKIYYININDGFIFMPKNNNFLFNNNYIYLYSSQINDHIKLNTPIAVIECYNINDRNNKFILISKELSDKNIIKNPLAYFKKIKLSCHLINTNNKIKSTNEENPKINIYNFNIKQNNFSIDENKKLINELKYYQEENEKLKNEIKKLKSDNNKINTELNKAKNIISSYQIKIQGINNEVNQLKNIIKEKEKEIYDLKIKSGLYVDYSKIMVVNFISLDYDINCGINCLETETFAEVEEKLYKQYEQCRETNNAFLSGGNMLKRFKKISENKIKNGDKIQLIIPQ